MNIHKLHPNDVLEFASMCATSRNSLCPSSQAGISILITVFLNAFPLFGGTKNEWKPVDPAQLSMKEPAVEKDAPAEALFWEIEVDDSGRKTVYNNYVRIKVFTQKGAEEQGKKQITYLDSGDVKDIAARTIRPNGAVVEMSESAVLEQKVLKVRKYREKAKSFVLPAVEPGCIIEYRWKEERSTPGYFRINLQMDIPIQAFKCSIKKVPFLAWTTFNFRQFELIPDEEKKGFLSRTVTNVPALKVEPYMPPLDSVRWWVLFYYHDDHDYTSRSEPFGKLVHRAFESRMKVNDDVRRVVRDLTGKDSTTDEKLRLLVEFCRDKIRRVDLDTQCLPAEEVSRFKSNKSPSDTLNQRLGTGTDVNLLFASLATAAGFKSRISMVADRSIMFYGPSSPSDRLIPYLLSAQHVAVFTDKGWRFFDPASVHVPFGMLRWQEEGLNALISDPDTSVIQCTPLSPPEESLIRRKATLNLLQDGTLEGDVRIEAIGHPAAEWREDERPLSLEERERRLSEAVKSRLNTANVSQIRFENLAEADKPYVYSYKIRIPAYAQRTGSRLFLQPAFFQRGIEKTFASNQPRLHPVYFAYAWSEDDSVTIDLPEGFQLDSPDAPNPFAANGIDFSPKLSITKDQRRFIYRRAFSLGAGGVIMFDTKNYPWLKQVFDYVREADDHTVALKQNRPEANKGGSEK